MQRIDSSLVTIASNANQPPCYSWTPNPRNTTPLCEGTQTTTLTLRSISPYFHDVQMSRDRGRTYEAMGILEPMATMQVWRASGETWRVVGAGGRVVKTIVTSGGRPTLVIQ